MAANIKWCSRGQGREGERREEKKTKQKKQQKKNKTKLELCFANTHWHLTYIVRNKLVF